ncbi:MAG: hypothetical protein E7262_06160 [Lachnospiraceae bacterium]|nr:hypothetical protein [Lachnospiraceae bacterium]
MNSKIKKIVLIMGMLVTISIIMRILLYKEIILGTVYLWISVGMLIVSFILAIVAALMNIKIRLEKDK